MINKHTNKYERKLTKTNGIKRQKTFNNQVFIDLDKDISEMNVNIKKYETLKKKNSFLDSGTIVKPSLNSKNKLNRINTTKIKNYDTYSIATNTSINDKTLKKVSFSTVEIIRVEKYKKYNAMNNVPKTLIHKNMEEVKNNKNNDDESSCFIF